MVDAQSVDRPALNRLGQPNDPGRSKSDCREVSETRRMRPHKGPSANGQMSPVRLAPISVALKGLLDAPKRSFDHPNANVRFRPIAVIRSCRALELYLDGRGVGPAQHNSNQFWAASKKEQDDDTR
jgi:hypothetical protein